MKGQNLQPRLLYPARLSFRFEGEIRSLTDNTKPALQQIVKEALWVKKKKLQLEMEILQVTKLTSKGIHTVKVGNHPYTNTLPKPEIMRMVQMQDTGDSLAVKRPTT